MTDTAITNYLKNKGIYVTSTRIMVYRIMSEHKGTINAAQIHKETMFKLDRVSVYRTLQIFLKKEIILVIPKAKGWPKYLVKNPDENKDAERPEQIIIYFTCNNCGAVKTNRIFRLSPELVPQNYKVRNCQIILDGRCSICNLITDNNN